MCSLKAKVYIATAKRRLLPSQRNTAGWLFSVTKRLRGSETGVTLIETLIALAILGLIAAAFLNGLATAARATFIADEQATAESLARSQMEYIKSQHYIDYDDPEHGDYELVTPLDGYSATIGVESLPDPEGGTLEDIQKIKVTVNHNDKQVLTVEGYKVDR